jgi:hypothetical protein
MVGAVADAPLSLSALLAGAAAALAMAAQPATIPDPVAFLVQARCPDGRLQIAEPDCPAQPQRAADPMLERRHDWPAPIGFMAQDALIGPDGPETLWDFAPFREFLAAKGDGGEVYAVEGGTVRIAMTQDGGKPYLQGFHGRGCGGSGWIAFRTDAPTGRWASVVARLSDQPVPSPCRTKSTSLTRYRLEAVTAPWIIGGRRRSLTLPTVISEHFNAASIERASHMERSFFARGTGRIIWEAWSKAAPVGADLEGRCPGSDWSGAPAPGWRLSDCRTATNLVADDGHTTGVTYGWPPAALAIP